MFTSSVSDLITLVMPGGTLPVQRGPAIRKFPPPLPVLRLPITGAFPSAARKSRPVLHASPGWRTNARDIVPRVARPLVLRVVLVEAERVHGLVAGDHGRAVQGGLAGDAARLLPGDAVDADRLRPRGLVRRCEAAAGQAACQQHRHRPDDQRRRDARHRQDADRVGARAKERGVPQRHHAAIAQDQVETGRGQRVDQHAPHE
ncbi:hypothetical protein G6F68_013604 [Rhizopus microsporus]|nr:hypothetical protein G6F68_013604 [Rhizopus microsporus]